MVSMVSESPPLNVMRCTIWYHLYYSKNVKNTHGGVLLLVKLQAIACNFTKSHTSPWLFFTFFELYKITKSRKASQISYSALATLSPFSLPKP